MHKLQHLQNQEEIGGFKEHFHEIRHEHKETFD